MLVLAIISMQFAPMVHARKTVHVGADRRSREVFAAIFLTISR